MSYLSVAETAKKWNISERSVRTIVLMDVYQAHFLLVRPGISPKMQKNQSDLTRKKKNQSFC